MIHLNHDNPLGSLIENKFGDKYLFSVNQSMVENASYQAKFNQEFNSTFNQEDTLYLIVGTDSGMLVNQLCSFPLKKGSAYVFIEFDEIIRLTSEQYNLDVQQRIRVCNQDNWQAEAKKIGLDIYFTLSKVEVIESFSVQYNYLAQYLPLYQYLEKACSRLMWKAQIPLKSLIFIEKQLENLGENYFPAINMGDRYQGKSALILAGGPSLDHYIEWIEENQAHYLVIAVSRIAKRLQQTKIKPDIFVSIDPNEFNYSVSNDIQFFEGESLLVNYYHLLPRILGNWMGDNTYLGTLFPWQTPLNVNNLEGLGPTVTHTAIWFALQLGIKDQILLGVDLCHSAEGYTHAKGSFEYNAGPEVAPVNKGPTVETNAGLKAETTHEYFAGIEIIQKLASRAKKLGYRIINPSPNSVNIEDVYHILINQIIVPNEEVLIGNFLQFYRDKVTSDYKTQHYHEVLDELERALRKLNIVRDKATQALKCNELLFQDDDPSQHYNYKLQMDDIEKSLHSDDLDEFTTLAQKFGVKELLYFLSPDDGQEQSNEEIRKSGEAYYNGIIFGATSFSRHIVSAVNRIESRLIELGQFELTKESIYRHLGDYDNTMLLESSDCLEHKEDEQTLIEIVDKFLSHYMEQSTYSLQEQNQIISVFIVMLQHALDEQERRVELVERNNRELFSLEEAPIVFNRENKFNFLGNTIKELQIRHHQLAKSQAGEESLKKIFDDDKKYELKKLKNVEKILSNHFELNDAESINKILASLNLLVTNYDGLEELKYLAKGFLNELNQAFDLAINDYSYANSKQTLEIALKRIVYISLDQQNLEMAIGCLEILSTLSPTYLIQLANLHLIIKDETGAIEIYTRYLESNPTDTSILYKMATLYEKQGIIDGAKFMYQEILHLDPDNAVAQLSLQQLN